MKIWILTQNENEFLEVKDIFINRGESSQIFGSLGNKIDDYTLLGKYSSNARAKEVLKDITSYMAKNAISTKKDNLGNIIELYTKNMLIYCMPKE